MNRTKGTRNTGRMSARDSTLSWSISPLRIFLVLGGSSRSSSCANSLATVKRALALTRRYDVGDGLPPNYWCLLRAPGSAQNLSATTVRSQPSERADPTRGLLDVPMCGMQSPHVIT